MKHFLSLILLALTTLAASKDLHLNSDSSIVAYLGPQDYKVKLLVDPMATMTYIFESRIPVLAISSSTRTKEQKTISTTYGTFSGEYIIETFKLGDDPDISFKLGFLLVKNTTSPLNKTYEGVIGLGHDEANLLSSVFKQASLRPLMKLSLKSGTISLGETSKMTDYIIPLFHVKQSSKGMSVLLFDLDSIKVKEGSLAHPIKGKGKLDLWKRNCIMAPYNQEKQLFFGYFNETTSGGLLYTDENSSNGYKNYFFPMSYHPSSGLKSFLEIDSKSHGFPSWYSEKDSNLVYSTIKLQLENGSDNWMIGAQVLGYEVIEFDFEKNIIVGYNQTFLFSWLYGILGFIGICSIALLIYFIRKKQQMTETKKKVEETELIDKKKDKDIKKDD